MVVGDGFGICDDGVCGVGGGGYDLNVFLGFVGLGWCSRVLICFLNWLIVVVGLLFESRMFCIVVLNLFWKFDFDLVN